MAKKKAADSSGNKISKTTIILYLVVITITVIVLSVMGTGASGAGGGCGGGCCDCSECQCICCDCKNEGCHENCNCVADNYEGVQAWDPFERRMVEGDEYWCDRGSIPPVPPEPACEPGISPPKDCPLQLGVCKGSKEYCALTNPLNDFTGNWPGCGSYTSVAGYEQDEITCDNLDNDCDGEIDEGCDEDEDDYCNKRMLCSGAKFEGCESGECTDCDDNNALKNPGEDEVCDGINNDCDHKTDEGCKCSPEGAERACEKTQGVCLGAKQICKKCDEIGCEEEGQLTGWTDCDYGANYMEGSETGGKLIARLCQDGLDNDCDNLIDCADGDCRRFCRTTAP